MSLSIARLAALFRSRVSV